MKHFKLIFRQFFTNFPPTIPFYITDCTCNQSKRFSGHIPRWWLLWMWKIDFHENWMCDGMNFFSFASVLRDIELESLRVIVSDVRMDSMSFEHNILMITTKACRRKRNKLYGKKMFCSFTNFFFRCKIYCNAINATFLVSILFDFSNDMNLNSDILFRRRCIESHFVYFRNDWIEID